LISLGLDVPFTSRLMAELAANGLDIGTEYLTEKELEEQLWELNLKM
ncbi:energy-coupling factor transporter ATPase, partial [Streptococcus sp. SPC0]|nr:energy-coupling factor transporter ATPase [Streptococcus sp. SPC0]